MVFYVIMVTFLVTTIVNKCTEYYHGMMDDNFKLIHRPKPYLLLFAHSYVGCVVSSFHTLLESLLVRSTIIVGLT